MSLIKTIEDLDRVRDECYKLVTTRSGMSAAAAAVPIPGVDLATDIGLLADLIPTINRKFGLTPEQMQNLSPELKQKIAVIATSVGSELIGKVVSKPVILALLKKVGIRVGTKSVTKFIPIVGTAFSAWVSFGAMKWMGNSHVKDCYDVMKQVIESETEKAA